MLEDRQGKCLSVLAKYLLREFSIAQEKVWGGGTELNGFMVLEWLKFMELFLLIQLLFTKAGVDTMCRSGLCYRRAIQVGSQI